MLLFCFSFSHMTIFINRIGITSIGGSLSSQLGSGASLVFTSNTLNLSPTPETRRFYQQHEPTVGEDARAPSPSQL